VAGRCAAPPAGEAVHLMLEFVDWMRECWEPSSNVPRPAWLNDVTTARSIYDQMVADEARQYAQSAQAKALDQLRGANRDLRTRLDGIEGWFRRSKTGEPVIMDMLIDAFGGALGHVRKELESRIEALEQRQPVPVQLPTVNELRPGAPALRYAGVWSPEKSYGAGSLVTKDGAAWVATNAMAAGVKPGDGATAWRLAIKSDTSQLRSLVKDEVRRQLGERAAPAARTGRA
jgi:hypothetical protein